MARLDALIERLFKENARELYFETGTGGVVRKDGAESPALRTALTSPQLLGAFAEIAPPALKGGIGPGRHQFTYASPAGPVAVLLENAGEKVRARVTVDSGAGASAPPASAPGAGAGAASARPAAAPVAPAAAAAPARPAAPVQAGVAAPGRPAGVPGGPVSPAGAAARPSAPAAPAPLASAAPAPVAPVAEARPLPSGPRNLSGDGGTVIDGLLREALGHKASDVHLVAGRPPLFRIATELVPSGEPLPPERVEAMASVVVPARLKASLEKDGSADFALARDGIGRFRVNVSRQRTGLKICLRVIPKEIPTLESLGLPAAIAHATHHHQGLIIVAGPSGHGKTSTLAAIVDIINTNSTHHIITVEDPIEYLHPIKKAMLSQREVGTHTKSFQSALKGSLREDPDVIVVGELRDTETVRMALQAGETGHLMIATMNTPSAAKTIDRLIDLFPPSDQQQVRMSVAGGLRLIVSQRLVPSADRKGVVAAVELLPGSTGLSNLIRDEKTYQIPSLQQRGKSMGIIRMDDSLAELVHSGRTSMEIAQQFAETPADLPNAVKALSQAANPAPVAEPEKKGAFGKGMGGLLGRKGG